MNGEKLCSNTVCVAERDAPTLVQQATVVGNKFQQAFNLCRLTYDSKDFLDDETIEISKVLLNYMYMYSRI